jgi:hypothetical protein
MNNLQDLIKRLSAIGQVTEAEEKCSECGCTPCECEDKEKVEEAKKPDADKDGVPDWADKKPGKDDKEEVDEGAMDKLKQLGKKALDTLGHKDDEELIKDMQKQQGVPQTGKKPEPVKENATLAILRQLAGIQEAKIEEDDVEEGNEFSGALKAAKDAGKEEFEVAGKKYKVNECGDYQGGSNDYGYPSSGQMSPMTMTGQEEPHMGIPAEVMAQMAANPEGEPEMAQPEMAAPEAPKATYTLSIQNGENNLQMTTDMPDEIIHIMKLAGVNKGAEVSKKETPAAGEQEVEESGYENTPDNTKARDPQAHGDIRDWGRKGTANASTHYTPAKSGDNPMNEQRMFDDYKNFKAGK